MKEIIFKNQGNILDTAKKPMLRLAVQIITILFFLNTKRIES